jgi:hypothetical protein
MMTSKDIQGNISLFTCRGVGMNLTTFKNYEVKYEELVVCYYRQFPVCPSRDPGSVPGQFISGICGGESSPGTEFSPSTSVLPIWYHSTNAPYSFCSFISDGM